MSIDDPSTENARFTAAAAVAQNTAMSEEAQVQQAPVAETAPLVFEQPLNERMRTFLRLDFLYNQALVSQRDAEPVGQPRGDGQPARYPGYRRKG